MNWSYIFLVGIAALAVAFAFKVKGGG